MLQIISVGVSQHSDGGISNLGDSTTSFFFGGGLTFGSYLAMLVTYSWLCAQGLLLGDSGNDVGYWGST